MVEGDLDGSFGALLSGRPISVSGLVFTFLAPSFASEATVKMVKKLTPLEEERLKQISSRAESDMFDRYQGVRQRAAEIGAVTDSTILGYTVCSACGVPISAVEEGTLSRSLFGEGIPGSVTSGVFCQNEKCSFYLKFVPVNKATQLTNVVFYPQMTVASENFLRKHPEFRRKEPSAATESPLTTKASLEHPVNKGKDNRKQESNVSAPQASEPLRLLLVRPILSEIFGSSVDPHLPFVSGKPLPAESVTVMTSFGFMRSTGFTEDMLCPVAILVVDKYGRVGYITTVRLDLRIAITRVADWLGLSIDQFFIGRDILIFTQEYYNMAIGYTDVSAALRHMNDPFKEVTLPKLCFVMAWTDARACENLRRMEAAAQYVLAPYSDRQEPVDWSDLPVLGGSWRTDVLDNLFLFVEARMNAGGGGLERQ